MPHGKVKRHWDWVNTGNVLLVKLQLFKDDVVICMGM